MCKNGSHAGLEPAVSTAAVTAAADVVYLVCINSMYQVQRLSMVILYDMDG